MLHTVITALLDKKALDTDTIVTASYHSRDLFGRTFYKTGEFKIYQISITEKIPIFKLKSIDNTCGIIQANAESITAIDGMDIFRYADIYDILPDGTNKKVGRKRGRKSKNLLNT
jgi:hypothetical protein